MSIQQVLDCYKAVTSSRNCEIAKVKRSAATYIPSRQYALLEQKIQVFPYTDGWLCFQSLVHMIEKEKEASNLPTNAGRILSGELVSERITMSIQQHNDGWYVSTVEELGSDDNDGEVVIARSESQALIRQNKRVAYYKVYLKAGESGYEPWCARLTGYSDQQGERK